MSWARTTSGGMRILGPTKSFSLLPTATEACEVVSGADSDSEVLCSHDPRAESATTQKVAQAAEKIGQGSN